MFKLSNGCQISVPRVTNIFFLTANLNVMNNWLNTFELKSILSQFIYLNQEIHNPCSVLTSPEGTRPTN